MGLLFEFPRGMVLRLFWLHAEDSATWNFGEDSSLVSESGGKAFHLHRLARDEEAFNIPRGVVLSEGEVPLKLLESILAHLHASTVAVRSSASEEDSQEASFAGQHSTFLHVNATPEDVLQAIQQCRASLENSSSQTYQQHMVDSNFYEESIDETDILAASQTTQKERPRMNVIVQEMIQPDAAGVCFSRHPVTNALDEILLECVPGVGESLVSGHATPDRFLFRRRPDDPLTIEHVSTQEATTGLATSLALPMASSVAMATIRVEARSGDIPQDVEFATKGDTVWILQSRPITTLLDQTEGDLLSNQPTREVLSAPMTCLSWTAFFETMEKAVAVRYGNRGVDYETNRGKDPRRGFFELRHGYLYQNLSLTDRFNRLEFGVSYKDALIPSFPEIPPELFDQCCDPSAVSRSNQVGGVLGMLAYLHKATSVLSSTDSVQEKYRAKFSIFQSWTTWKKRDERDLMKEFESIQIEFAEFSTVYVDIQVYLQVFNSVVEKTVEHMCPKTLAEEPGCIWYLLVGLGDVITHDMNNQLYAFLDAASRDSGAQKLVKNPSRWRQWRKRLGNTPVAAQLEQFLEDFGHRACHELEVSSPRWGNDPTYIFELLRMQIESPESNQKPTDIHALQQHREKIEKKILKECGFLARSLVRWAIHNLQRLTRFRENLKDIVIRFISHQQQLVLALAHRRTKDGTFSNPDDVYHLGIAQLRALAAGTLSSSAAQSAVKMNRTMYERFSQSVPSRVFIGLRPWRIPVVTKTQQDHSGCLQFVGTGGAPGVAQAEALLIHSIEEAHLLSQATRPILIAPLTDPAWTPLFLRVEGVVVESGGILSHAAIVAREFGIPCVFGIPGLMQRLASGTLVHVDGTNGIVTVVQNNEQKSSN